LMPATNSGLEWLAMGSWVQRIRDQINAAT
jgi:hypothetical protein